MAVGEIDWFLPPYAARGSAKCTLAYEARKPEWCGEMQGKVIQGSVAVWVSGGAARGGQG